MQTQYIKSRNRRFIIFLIFTFIAPFANSEQNMLKEYRFTLTSKAVEEEYGLVVGQMKGNISIIEVEEDHRIYELRVNEVNYEFENSKAKSKAAKYQPFSAKVSVSNSSKIPLSIDITKGGIDNGLNGQYRMAYLLLDMMLITTNEKDFIVQKNNSLNSLLTLHIIPPDKVNLRGIGEVSLKSLRSSISPMNFFVLPKINNNLLVGWEYISTTSDSLNFDYFYRYLDKENNIVTHSVNIEATAKQKIKEEEFEQMINTIDDPNNYQTYYLYELKLESTK